MKRAYQSALRAEQADRTRERIIEALAEQLGDAREEFSIGKVAERAGVSVRTVYHHFPNREEQIEAVAKWIDERLAASDPGPGSFAELVPYTERMIRRGVRNLPLIRLQLMPGIASAVRARRRRVREGMVRKAVEAKVGGERGRLAAIALSTLISADLAIALADRYGLEGEELIATHVWVVRAAVRAIEAGDVI